MVHTVSIRTKIVHTQITASVSMLLRAIIFIDENESRRQSKRVKRTGTRLGKTGCHNRNGSWVGLEYFSGFHCIYLSICQRNSSLTSRQNPEGEGRIQSTWRGKLLPLRRFVNTKLPFRRARPSPNTTTPLIELDHQPEFVDWCNATVLERNNLQISTRVISYCQYGKGSRFLLLPPYNCKLRRTRKSVDVVRCTLPAAEIGLECEGVVLYEKGAILLYSTNHFILHHNMQLLTLL
jgi:hypothetical protein